MKRGEEKPERKSPLLKYLPTRQRTICPAPMLAANRTAKVTGRTKSLTVSTRTRKGLKKEGAPTGSKTARKDPKL
jgi:hypothetical protein